MNRIKVEDRADREQLALILVKAGYTVRIVKVKSASSKYDYYVEYGGTSEQ